MEIKENVAYWCKTEELAKEFLKECEKQGVKFIDTSVTIKTCWEVYKRETCYSINLNLDKIKVVSYGRKQFYEVDNIKIIEFTGEQKMNKEEIQAEIKAMQEQINKFNERLNILSTELGKCENEQVLNVWRPNENEKYFYMNFAGNVEQELNNNYTYDLALLTNGNYYKTEEKAQFEAQREKYTRLFRKYVEEHSEPMDSRYIKLERFYAYWDIENQTIEIANHKGYIDAFQIYASSEEIIRNAIKFIGEENFKKYILEVE